MRDASYHAAPPLDILTNFQSWRVLLAICRDLSVKELMETYLDTGRSTGKGDVIVCIASWLTEYVRRTEFEEVKLENIDDLMPRGYPNAFQHTHIHLI